MVPRPGVISTGDRGRQGVRGSLGEEVEVLLFCSAVSDTIGGGLPGMTAPPMATMEALLGAASTSTPTAPTKRADAARRGKGESTCPCETAHVCTSSVSECVPDGDPVATALHAVAFAARSVASEWTLVRQRPCDCISVHKNEIRPLSQRLATPVELLPSGIDEPLACASLPRTLLRRSRREGRFSRIDSGHGTISVSLSQRTHNRFEARTQK